MTRGELALLLQHLERKGGRRQRQGQADEQGLRGAEAQHHANRGKHHRRGDHLDRAEPEDRRAKCPKPDRAELEPDHEQQHHHAELAEMEHRVDVVERVKRAEHVRPDDHAGGEIAEHGAQAQRAPERCGNDGGGEKHRHLNELRRHHGLPSDFLDSA